MFDPQRYLIPDTPNIPFIDKQEIIDLLSFNRFPSSEEVATVLAKSMDRKRLDLKDTAVLLNAGPDNVDNIFDAASRLKKEVYGERIVIFAPLYIGNRCVNNCSYCGFRASNSGAIRRTLEMSELRSEVVELEKTGQKRLILVYREHPKYDAHYIADTVRTVYDTRKYTDRIDRVNINAAPMDVEGFRTIKKAGIGTYQIFQETYDPDVYRFYHPSSPKKDYNWRLTAMDRAMQAGIDDVGLGVLFGL